MIDDRKTPGSSAEATGDPVSASEARVGFCQECGCGLTATTLHRDTSGVFCPPCAAQHHASAAWQPVDASYAGAARPPLAGDANPVRAAVLGFIPGVGAMYNGQYAKGAMHLIVFVVLVSVADNVNWVFYWLVWGWVFYQAFDAYHTASARRDGLPLPNPFGWNDLGERIGLYRTSPPPEPIAKAPNAAVAQDTRANWAGYVPPTEFGRQAYAPRSQPAQQSPYTAPYAEAGPRPVPPPDPLPPSYVPYAPTYTAAAPSQVTGVNTLPGAQRFPIGALWLICLGTVFLVGNLLPEWRVSGRWLVPLLLAALAAWSAVRRWEQFQTRSLPATGNANLMGAMVGPVLLFTVAVLLALQAGHAASLHRSWPVLLVVWGGMLLLQRTAPPPLAAPRDQSAEAVPPPVRSTSGTGSLGL